MCMANSKCNFLYIAIQLYNNTIYIHCQNNGTSVISTINGLSNYSQYQITMCAIIATITTTRTTEHMAAILHTGYQIHDK